MPRLRGEMPQMLLQALLRMIQMELEEVVLKCAFPKRDPLKGSLAPRGPQASFRGPKVGFLSVLMHGVMLLCSMRRPTDKNHCTWYPAIFNTTVMAF